MLIVAQVAAADPWYLRALLIALSTFTGGTAAFLLARWAKARDERLENITAGNSALFALIDQFNTLKLIADQYLNPVRSSPTRWIELKETPELPPYLRLASADLRFLLRGGADATLLLRLHEAERNCDIALQVLKARTSFFITEIRVRLMPIFETCPATGQVSMETIEATLGHALIVGLKERTENLFEAVDEAMSANDLVFKMLQKHLEGKFPEADILDRKIVQGQARDKSLSLVIADNSRD